MNKKLAALTGGIALAAFGALAANNILIQQPNGQFAIIGSTDIGSGVQTLWVSSTAPTISSTAFRSGSSLSGVLIKGSTGTLFGLNLWSVSTTEAYIKIYDTSTAPTCGSQFTAPAVLQAFPSSSPITFGPGGLYFQLGIGLCVSPSPININKNTVNTDAVGGNVLWQ